jgi:hypothetical protein
MAFWQYEYWGQIMELANRWYRVSSPSIFARSRADERWVRSWILFRLAIIAQGISARAALGQASSADAKADNRIFNFFGRMAWDAKGDSGRVGAKL